MKLIFIFAILLYSIECLKKKNLSNQRQNFSDFKFRSYQTFLNNGQYASINELPIFEETRLQLANIENMNRRILFYGFSQDILIESAKTLSLENNYLYKEINVKDLILEFIENQNHLNFIFKNAYEDSIVQKKISMLVFIDIEILFSNKQKYIELRQWFQQEIIKYTIKTTDKMNGNLIVVMTCQQPYLLDQFFIQNIANKAIFFDFPDLRIVKVLLSNAIIELESRSKIQYDRLEAENEVFPMPIGKQTQQSLQIQKDQELIQKLEQVTDNQYSFLQTNQAFNPSLKQQPQLTSQNEEQEIMVQRNGLFRCQRFQTLQVQQQSNDEQFQEIPNQLPNTQIITNQDLQIIIEKRHDVRYKYNPSLLGQDNILILTGKRVCIVFDGDFDYFLADRTQAIKIETGFFDKVGFTENDIKNVIRYSILSYQLKVPPFQQNKFDQIEQYYEITSDTIKQGFLNYRPNTNLHLANKLMEFHNNYDIHFQQQLITDRLIQRPISTQDTENFINYQQSQIERPQDIWGGKYLDEKNQGLTHQKFQKSLNQQKPVIQNQQMPLMQNQVLLNDQNQNNYFLELNEIRQKNQIFNQKIDSLQQQLKQMSSLQNQLLQKLDFKQNDYNIKPVVKLQNNYLESQDDLIINAKQMRDDIEKYQTSSLLGLT